MIDDGISMNAWRSLCPPYIRLSFAFLLMGMMISTLTGCGGSISGSGQNPDPVLADFPIAFIKRPVPVNDQGNTLSSDARRVLTFTEGGDLYLRDRASTTAAERNITY